MQAPPDRATLERILDLLADPPAALVCKDEHFRELRLDPAAYEIRVAVIEVLLARPCDKVLELLAWGSIAGRTSAVAGDATVDFQITAMAVSKSAPYSGPREPQRGRRSSEVFRRRITDLRCIPV